MGAFLCTGCTVCCGAMDGKEQRMYRMYGMLRCHGWQRATHVQDVRYVAVPWMAKSNACPWMDGLKITPRQLLLRCPTTVHPWTYALP